MAKARVIETNEGIQNELTVADFNVFARMMRDKGMNGVEDIIASGIKGGDILEIGPGPGYVGLEVAKKLSPKSLTGCEISPVMIRTAEKNAADYGIQADYVLGNAMEMPFADESFDTVISNASLHEWENPMRIFDEMHRVLRPGGRFCITDLRRDSAFWKKAVAYLTTSPKKMRPGMLTSVNAAYTAEEITVLISCAKFKSFTVQKGFMTLCISGEK